MKIIPLLTMLFFFCKSGVPAQSPFRIFTLDCHLNHESERATASLATRAFLIRQPDILRDAIKIKPFVPMNWNEFQQVIDTLHAKLPIDGTLSWEEDYGLKADGEAGEKWRELTFYQCDLQNGIGGADMLNAKRRYLLQMRINLDMNGQIKSILYLQGKQIINRDRNILHAYRILYKSSLQPKKTTK